MDNDLQKRVDNLTAALIQLDQRAASAPVLEQTAWAVAAYFREHSGSLDSERVCNESRRLVIGYLTPIQKRCEALALALEEEKKSHRSTRAKLRNQSADHKQEIVEIEKRGGRHRERISELKRKIVKLEKHVAEIESERAKIVEELIAAKKESE